MGGFGLFVNVLEVDSVVIYSVRTEVSSQT